MNDAVKEVLASALQQISDQGYVLRMVRAGYVLEGDYLLSYPYTKAPVGHDRNVQCERIIRTNNDWPAHRYTLELEGNPEPQPYSFDQPVLILRKTD